MIASSFIRKLEGTYGQRLPALRRFHNEILRGGDDGFATAIAKAPRGSNLPCFRCHKRASPWKCHKILPFRFTLINSLEPEEDEVVLAVAFNGDGTLLASGSDKGTIKIWDTDGNCVETLEITEEMKKDYDPDSYTDTGFVWSTKADNYIPIKGHRRSVTSLAWNPDGTRLASAARDFTVIIWNTGTWKFEKTHLFKPYSVPMSVAWKNKNLVAVAYRTGEVIFGDTTKGEGEVFESVEDPHGIGSEEDQKSERERDVFVAGNGDRFALVSKRDGMIWYSKSPLEIKVEKGYGTSVAWGGTDGSLLAIGYHNGYEELSKGTVRIWITDKTPTAQPMKTLEYDAAVRSVAFHKNLLVAGCADGMIQIFDVESGQVQNLKIDSPVESVALAGKDTVFLASLKENGTINMWSSGNSDKVPSGSQISHLQVSLRKAAYVSDTPLYVCKRKAGSWMCEAQSKSPESITRYITESPQAMAWVGTGNLAVARGRAISIWENGMCKKTLGDVNDMAGFLQDRHVIKQVIKSIYDRGVQIALDDALKNAETYLEEKYRFEAGNIYNDEKKIGTSDDIAPFLKPEYYIRRMIYDKADKSSIALDNALTDVAINFLKENHTLKGHNIYDKNGKSVKTWHGGKVTSMAWKNGTLASGSEDETIKIWNVKTGECKMTLGTSPQEADIFIEDMNKIWATETEYTNKNGSEIPKDDGGWIWKIGEDTVAEMSSSGIFTAYLKGQKIGQYEKGHKSAVKFLAFNGDGTLLASASEDPHTQRQESDNTIRIWDMNTGKCKMTENIGDKRFVTSMAWGGKNDILVVGYQIEMPTDGYEGYEFVWRDELSSLIQQPAYTKGNPIWIRDWKNDTKWNFNQNNDKDETGETLQLAFNQDNQLLASLAAQREKNKEKKTVEYATVSVWKTDSPARKSWGRPIFQFKRNKESSDSSILGMAWCAKYVLATLHKSQHSSIRLWDVLSGNAISNPLRIIDTHWPISFVCSHSDDPIPEKADLAVGFDNRGVSKGFRLWVNEGFNLVL